MSYEWKKNCAVVDRCFYLDYMIKGTTLIALLSTVKDVMFLKNNWYPERAKKRLVFVIK